MNASANKDWNADLNLDGFASVAVLAASVLIVAFAALSSNVEATPKVAQVVSVA